MPEEVLALVHRPEGWFIEGAHPVGPIPTRQRARELAEGMAYGLSLIGTRARITEPRSWRETPPAERLRRWRGGR